MSEQDRQRYFEALHGVQSAIAFEIGVGVAHQADAKHLRVGVDSAHISNGALVELLIEKGIITLDEYDAKLAHYAERELLGYEAKYPYIRFR